MDIWLIWARDGELRVATGYPRVYGPHVELVEQGR